MCGDYLAWILNVFAQKPGKQHTHIYYVSITIEKVTPLHVLTSVLRQALVSQTTAKLLKETAAQFSFLIFLVSNPAPSFRRYLCKLPPGLV